MVSKLQHGEGGEKQDEGWRQANDHYWGGKGDDEGKSGCLSKGDGGNTGQKDIELPTRTIGQASLIKKMAVTTTITRVFHLFFLLHDLKSNLLASRFCPREVAALCPSPPSSLDRKEVEPE